MVDWDEKTEQIPGNPAAASAVEARVPQTVPPSVSAHVGQAASLPRPQAAPCNSPAHGRRPGKGSPRFQAQHTTLAFLHHNRAAPTLPAACNRVGATRLRSGLPAALLWYPHPRETKVDRAAATSLLPTSSVVATRCAAVGRGWAKRATRAGVRRKSFGDTWVMATGFVIGVIALSILRKSLCCAGLSSRGGPEFFRFARNLLLRPRGLWNAISPASRVASIWGVQPFRSSRGRESWGTFPTCRPLQGTLETCPTTANAKGPAHGNPPGDGPLLIPEQPLQALPVPDRLTLLSIRAATEYQPKF